MNTYIASMGMALVSILLYHTCQKTIPSGANVICSLLVTYSAALILSLCLYPFFSAGETFLANLKSVNWVSAFLDVAIVLMEVGFLLAYRAGWQISRASLFANASVAILSVPIGVLVYKESLSAKNGVGIVLALVGIILMVK